MLPLLLITQTDERDGTRTKETHSSSRTVVADAGRCFLIKRDLEEEQDEKGKTVRTCSHHAHMVRQSRTASHFNHSDRTEGSACLPFVASSRPPFLASLFSSPSPSSPLPFLHLFPFVVIHSCVRQDDQSFLFNKKEATVQTDLLAECVEKEIRHSRPFLSFPKTMHRPLSLLDDSFPIFRLRSNTKMMIKGSAFCPSLMTIRVQGHKHLSSARQMITPVVMGAKWPAVPVVGHESKSSQSIPSSSAEKPELLLFSGQFCISLFTIVPPDV